MSGRVAITSQEVGGHLVTVENYGDPADASIAAYIDGEYVDGTAINPADWHKDRLHGRVYMIAIQDTLAAGIDKVSSG